MNSEQRRKLRHDILGCLNSIKLSSEVIRGADDHNEAVAFVECIGNEVAKVERFTAELIYDSQGSAPIPPTNAYHFIPMTDPR